MRITVISDLDRNEKIKRIAFIKKPIFNARKEKYIWTTVENYTIPELKIDENYLVRKKSNFDMKLNEWDKRLNKKEIPIEKVGNKFTESDIRAFQMLANTIR